ncbi:Histidine kinase-, DNA gyrase B-, and HSP90-like ATPase [Thermomonospora echinospora]|uniref:Oxygen sensor histidine kinase NreB n=1 Tax=Thermomonospora echinospora TaxID=1992 RepID=A0A1H5VDD5_9ACTN|nr:ATP-binding protein [Thermomonospora echinospora]SEF85319.1 Histidine kinase-, DNA gyrase B-, and HSP90-like ATPase [Thermomonospora echinospora]
MTGGGARTDDPASPVCRRIDAILERYRGRLAELGNPLAADDVLWERHARWSRRVIEESLRPEDPAGAPAGRQSVCGGARGGPRAAVGAPGLAEAGHTLFAVVMRSLEESARQGAIEGETVARVAVALHGRITSWLASHGGRHQILGRPAEPFGRAERAGRIERTGRVERADLTEPIETRVRREVAREVHDRIGGSLYLAMRQLELLQLLAGGRPERPEAATARLEAVRSALLQLNADTRDLVAGLRRPHSAGSLEAALRSFVDALAHPRTTVHLQVSEELDALPARLRDELFLVVRECLRNCLAHAAAPNVWARIDVDPAEVAVRVVDDGVGFDLAEVAARGTTNGLSGLGERVAALHGEHLVESRPGHGTRITISIPIRAPEAS